METYLGEGDSSSARRVVQQPPAGVDPVNLGALLVITGEYAWLLQDSVRARVLALPPAAFDNNRGTWAFARAVIYRERGDTATGRIWADTAAREFARQSRLAPESGLVHMVLGTALVYAGRRAEAIAEGKRAVEMVPIASDADLGPFVRHGLARIYVFAGEPELAIDQLEAVLKVPFYVSAAWLGVDPDFRSLRGHPRFEALIAAR
jgi:tetratricopeptide (TPR) repeat protein